MKEEALFLFQTGKFKQALTSLFKQGCCRGRVLYLGGSIYLYIGSFTSNFPSVPEYFLL